MSLLQKSVPISFYQLYITFEMCNMLDKMMKPYWIKISIDFNQSIKVSVKMD